jgi:hypothetical protein
MTETVTEPVTYPDVDAIAAWAGVAPPADASECGTISVPPTVIGVPGVTTTTQLHATYPADCDGVGPFAPPPALTAADASRDVACTTAREAMDPDDAPYASRFYSGTGDPQPSCDPDARGVRRINVKLATGSPLVGFGQTATDAATGALDTTVPPQFGTVAQLLGAFGIHLGTSLPSLLCPEISVTVEQPVREPIFDRDSSPNGLATARRIVKNAVVVPVYEGDAIGSVSTGTVRAAAFGEGVETDGPEGTIAIPPRNINSDLIALQAELLTLLDEVDAIADAAIRAGGVTVDELNGTFTGIDPTAEQPPPVPGTGPLQGLRLTQCLRDTMKQIYDPPSGDAPTADEVLEEAARTGEQVIVVQVGSVRAACTEPGAIRTVRATPGNADECVRAATTPSYDPLTGVWEVPFFDATPVIVQDVGDGNFVAVPLHASQAAGAFRGGLVRDKANDRYDPDVRQPRRTPACTVTVPVPAATPTATTTATACDVLSYSPSPLPTDTPLPTVSETTLLPSVDPSSPAPSVDPSTLPPSVDPSSPVPSVSPPSTTPISTPTPTTTCIGILCGVTR